MMITIMGGNPVAIGPFAGGLNLREDARQIADNQLASCINFDIGRAGELSTRTGLKAFRVNGVNPLGLPANTKIVGTIRNSTTGTSRIYSVEVDTQHVYHTDSGVSDSVNWTSTYTGAYTGSFSRVIQYINRAIFIPKGNGAGGGGAGFYQDISTLATVDQGAAIPKGSGGTIFKDRLFVFGPPDTANIGSQRIYYSISGVFPTGTPTIASFPALNYFDVSAGDGENVTAIVGMQDTLVIFKQHSVWSIQFDTDPGLGILRKISNEIGATGPDAIVSSQNEVYIVDERTIWRMQNFIFDDIGKTLNLGALRSSVDFRTIFDDTDLVSNRVLFTVATGFGTYKYFLYNSEIGAFSEYQFSETPVKFFPITDLVHSETHVAHNAAGTRFYYFQPFNTDAANYGDYPDNITHVHLATRRFDYTGADAYKRLFWWGVEAISNEPFQLSCETDETLLSAVATRAASKTGKHAYYRAYLPARFRFIQYILDSVEPSLNMTLLSGVAMLGAKREVSAGETI